MRGKVVEPIKSCLNYIKHVMHHLKVDYETRNFGEVYNPEIGQDTTRLEQDLKEGIRSSYRNALKDDLAIIAGDVPHALRKIIAQSPYRNDPVMCSKLSISCQLTFLNDIISAKARSTKNKRKRAQNTESFMSQPGTPEKVLL